MPLFAVLIRWVIYAPITAILPVLQIWVMLLARYFGWWPEPGITWFDWIVVAVVPGYALFQAVFG